MEVVRIDQKMPGFVVAPAFDPMQGNEGRVNRIAETPDDHEIVKGKLHGSAENALVLLIRSFAARGLLTQ
jgi:hypothetical protein